MNYDIYILFFHTYDCLYYIFYKSSIQSKFILARIKKYQNKSIYYGFILANTKLGPKT